VSDDALKQLLRDLETVGHPSFEWIVRHAPGGEFRRLWARGPDPVVKLRILALLGDALPLARGAVLVAELLLADLPDTRAHAGAVARATRAWLAGRGTAEAAHAAATALSRHGPYVDVFSVLPSIVVAARAEDGTPASWRSMLFKLAGFVYDRTTTYASAKLHRRALFRLRARELAALAPYPGLARVAAGVPV